MKNQLSSNQPAGGSKSPEKGNTGNGAEAAAKTGKVLTVESLPSSARRDRQNISKEHVLEIFQSAIVMLQNKDIDVRVVPVYRKTTASQIIIVVEGVLVDAGNLVFEVKR